MNDDDLIKAALNAMERSHSPYSGFRVGAAVQDEHGAVHLGCNVENASYSEGACAETNAIGAMVAAGGRRIAVIAVVGSAARTDSPFAGVANCTPCGGCRQRIAEFADGDTRIVVQSGPGELRTYTVDELLPDSFSGG